MIYDIAGHEIGNYDSITLVLGYDQFQDLGSSLFHLLAPKSYLKFVITEDMTYMNGSQGRDQLEVTPSLLFILHPLDLPLAFYLFGKESTYYVIPYGVTKRFNGFENLRLDSKIFTLTPGRNISEHYGVKGLIR